jgi:putative membrane protein
VRILSYIFLLIIIFFGISFAVLNADMVTINYYFGEVTLALSLLVVIVFASGCLLGMIVSLIWLIKIKISNYHLKQRLQAAEKEMTHLRTIPLQDKA